MLDRRRKPQQRRNLDNGRRHDRLFLVDQVDMKHAIRRRMSDARGLAPHLGIEEPDFDDRENQCERDTQRNRATVRRRTRPAQTSLPGSRIAGERQRCNAMPVGLNVAAIELCGQRRPPRSDRVPFSASLFTAR